MLCRNIDCLTIDCMGLPGPIQFREIRLAMRLVKYRLILLHKRFLHVENHQESSRTLAESRCNVEKQL